MRAALAELQPALPAGRPLPGRGRRERGAGEQLRDLVPAGAIAFVAVMLVLAIALRRRGRCCLVMGSAAVAIAGTALGLYLLDIPANLLTLAGLGMGIGILVQDGLVVVDRLRTVPDTPEARAEAGRRITPAVVGFDPHHRGGAVPVPLPAGQRARGVRALRRGLRAGARLVGVRVGGDDPGRGRAARHARVRWPRLRRVYLHALIRLLRWRWATIVVDVLRARLVWAGASR